MTVSLEFLGTMPLNPGGSTSGKLLVSASSSSLSVNVHCPRSMESK